MIRAELTRAALYTLLGRGFCVPRADLLAGLGDLSGETRLHLPALAGDGELTAALDALAAALANANVEELETEYNRLFTGATPCSPHETGYGPAESGPANELADIAGFYRAFGLRPAAGQPYQPDYVGSELEFMAVLCQKAAYAAVNGWPDRRAICIEAQRRFLQDHLGRWLHPFCRHLAGQTASAYYLTIADLAWRFVAWDMAYIGEIAPTPARRRAAAPATAPAPGGPGPLPPGRRPPR